MIATMMARISRSGYYTNHSLRATAATRLYERGYDNQAISSVTGHGTTAVEEYKRLTAEKVRNYKQQSEI